jgi:hypothetical protein
VRRGEQSDAQSGRAVDAFEHRADGALAVGAGDVDEPQLGLRVAHRRGEPLRGFQPELRAKDAEGRKKFYGGGVGRPGFILHPALILFSAVTGDDESAARRR